MQPEDKFSSLGKQFSFDEPFHKLTHDMDHISLIPLLEKAIASRAAFVDSQHESGFRLFNGFTEGFPDLVIDLFASTFVFYNYADHPELDANFLKEAQGLLLNRLPWIHAGIVKTRNGKSLTERNGKQVFGTQTDRRIQEHGIWYAIDLVMHRDSGLYLDTRDLRKWLAQNSSGRSLLNTFAYTGSFGVAASGGGASRVVQVDRNRRFLNLAKDSYSLNRFAIHKPDFITADFFPTVSKLKRADQTFDILILDPPFFSTTPRGRVDQEHDTARLINKVRPLINDQGILITINNALYVSGKEFVKTLERLCEGGYMKIKDFIPVPEDFTGFPDTRVGSPVTDPAPFNHPTKIAILEVRRK